MSASPTRRGSSLLEVGLNSRSRAVVDSMSDADHQAQGVCPPGIPMSEARKLIKEFMVDEFLNQNGVHGDRTTHIFEKEMD